MSAARRHRPSSGFTLIEVMIVVVIIGVLTAVALPAYNAYIDRARRADARTQLLQVAQFMQRFYAANDRFDQDRAGTSVVSVMPRNLWQSPADTTTPYYQLNSTITSAASPTFTVTTTAYTLTMAPISGRLMANDPCGAFRINSMGVRTVTGTGKTRDECWR